MVLDRQVKSRFAAFGLLQAVAFLMLAVPAFGQIPQPRIADVNQRSGLLTRFIQKQPTLPPDRKRDSFFNTRYADDPMAQVNRPNSMRNGGLYGMTWKSTCTTCTYPYFMGSPGKGSRSADCLPPAHGHRFASAVLHPFRPVDSYYAGGCRVPIYDLDPLVPGPGSAFWTVFAPWPLGG